MGRPGRTTLAKTMSKIRTEYKPDFIIANGENAAGGIGITRAAALEVYDAGVDAITLGNHTWAKKEIYSYLDSEERIIRPANYPEGTPGRGYGVYTSSSGEEVAVISLCGRIFMEPLDNPFRAFDSVINDIKGRAKTIIVDFHAEATSEKAAFAWYADGRAAAVIGTHTHVQTADERILPGGTAFITDVGMTGPTDSVIGVKTDLIVARFLTQIPNKFEVAEGPTVLSAVVLDIDPESGKTSKIERIQIKYAQIS